MLPSAAMSSSGAVTSRLLSGGSYSSWGSTSGTKSGAATDSSSSSADSSKAYNPFSLLQPSRFDEPAPSLAGDPAMGSPRGGKKGGKHAAAAGVIGRSGDAALTVDEVASMRGLLRSAAGRIPRLSWAEEQKLGSLVSLMARMDGCDVTVGIARANLQKQKVKGLDRAGQR